ncbi:hypothetical protein L6452_21512 [Arctium lappa]|uniref:Uncharacterized protein n=1 Tax=Arctium lappa TaxID=4217 RepID=A0ACB9AXW2_ARCLA|nr:hypothetical protein L6452_21512 [Arctium lappa]
MKDLRSKSYNGTNMQIDPYTPTPHPSNFQDFRCHSSSHYTSSSSSQTQIDNPTAVDIKKDSRSISRIWSLNDPELQRKKRVASYKAYSVEGKVKGSIKKSFRWIKDRYTKMVYGLRS